jgi:hypothetical protein
MVALSDATAVTPQATGYGGIVAALLYVQDEQTTILDRQTLLKGSDLADRFPRAGVFLPSCCNVKSALAAMVGWRSLGRVQAVPLFGRQPVEGGPCHQPHAPPCQAVHEGRRLRCGRVEPRQRFHDADEGIVDQLFRLRFAAAVALQLEAKYVSVQRTKAKRVRPRRLPELLSRSLLARVPGSLQRCRGPAATNGSIPDVREVASRDRYMQES